MRCDRGIFGTSDQAKNRVLVQMHQAKNHDLDVTSSKNMAFQELGEGSDACNFSK